MKKLQSGCFSCLLAALALFTCLPLFMVFTGSFMSNDELRAGLLPLIREMKETVSWHFLPQYPTLRHYLYALFDRYSFLLVLWNTIVMTLATLAGQMLVGVPAAWAFARYGGRTLRFLYTLYVILMLLPFQVTMLSNYLVLDGLHLMDTRLAVILPGIFSTFPVFIMYRGFCDIPESLMESARIDGAGEFTIFLRVGLPLASTGILSALILEFLEYWSLIEQPMTFLKDPALWPLSLYLPQVDLNNAGFAFAASAVTMLPAVIVFFLGQEYLEQGIAASAIKE